MNCEKCGKGLICRLTNLYDPYTFNLVTDKLVIAKCNNNECEESKKPGISIGVLEEDTNKPT